MRRRFPAPSPEGEVTILDLKHVSLIEDDAVRDECGVFGAALKGLLRRTYSWVLWHFSTEARKARKSPLLRAMR